MVFQRLGKKSKAIKVKNEAMLFIRHEDEEPLGHGWNLIMEVQLAIKNEFEQTLNTKYS